MNITGASRRPEPDRRRFERLYEEYFDRVAAYLVTRTDRDSAADGVAAITLRYPSSTLTMTSVDNVVAAAVPNPGGPLSRPLTMVWRSRDGTILKTVHGRL